MILTRGLGVGGGLPAAGYGAWIGGGGSVAQQPERKAGSVGGKVRNRRVRRIEDDDVEMLELFNMIFAGGIIK